jgi:hypothetical protein
MHDYPILEYDADAGDAIIEPAKVLKFCFFRDVLDVVCAEAETIYMLGSEIGPNAVYGLRVPDHNGVEKPVAVLHPGVGAPLAAAFFAVARFRGVDFAQLLYGGDDVSGDVWDHRGWQQHKTGREKLFWLAVEAVLRL